MLTSALHFYYKKTNHFYYFERQKLKRKHYVKVLTSITSLSDNAGPGLAL